MEIRYATADDHAGIIALEAEIQTQHHQGAPSVFPPTGVISREDYVALLEAGDERIIVAVDDGVIVGYLQYEMRDRTSTYYMYPEKLLYVIILKVKDTHHRRGIGDALMERAEQIGREAGAHRISLEVYTFNAGAVRFYERIGFEKLKHVMSKPLSEDKS